MMLRFLLLLSQRSKGVEWIFNVQSYFSRMDVWWRKCASKRKKVPSVKHKIRLARVNFSAQPKTRFTAMRPPYPVFSSRIYYSYLFDPAAIVNWKNWLSQLASNVDRYRWKKEKKIHLGAEIKQKNLTASNDDNRSEEEFTSSVEPKQPKHSRRNLLITSFIYWSCR